MSARFLLAMWEGGGTVPPMLGAARRLIARGHRVRVLGDPTIRIEAEKTGCAFTPWRRAPHRTDLRPESDLLRDWEAPNPVAMLRKYRDEFLVALAHDDVKEPQRVGREALRVGATENSSHAAGSVRLRQRVGQPARLRCGRDEHHVEVPG